MTDPKRPDPSDDLQRRTLRDLAVVPSSRPAPGSTANFVLVVMSGPQIGERRTVDADLMVGRDPAAQLSIRDATVSWSHARFRWREGALEVEDLGSRHGTLVNGVSVERPMIVHDGDDIELGKTRLKVELHGPVELLFDRAVAARLEHDDLTGLSTRRKFDADLEGRLEAASKNQRVVALVLLDLDGLKRVNDAHGHACGAEVIRRVGEALRLGLTPGIGGCRFGGDEFAFAANLDEKGAVALAQALIGVVSDVRIDWDGAPVSVRASAGVAVTGEKPEAVSELFARADQALFDAKRRGGAQVVAWSHLPPRP